MPLDLYYWPALAGCRAVLLVGDALGIEFSLHLLDVLQREHLRQEFILINPMKTVPALKDGDIVIFESYAICTYLINRYAKDDFLYPKDPVRRVKVDQFLFFTNGPLSKNLMNCLDPRQPKSAFTQAYDSLSVINTQLGRAPYIAGYHITVADFVLAPILSAAEALLTDFDKQTNIVAWLQKCKTDIPGYKRLNEPGLEQFVALYNSKKKKDGQEAGDPNKLSVLSAEPRRRDTNNTQAPAPAPTPAQTTAPAQAPAPVSSPSQFEENKKL
ncbi:Glutathione S-transferase N-terminal [Trinorchestia longiramus]|nr:Glutathione S-transferase N-terminal [Trinorchestia longiramus]